MASFFDVLTEAVADISEHGYDSQDRIDFWLREIKRAAEESLKPEHVMEQMLNDAMRTLYARLVEKQGLLKYNPGVARFTLDRVKPQLRAELDRRIMASANLIKLNRQQAIAKTLQRFSGWSTSIPKGGTETVDRREVKGNIRKALTQLPFEERRVLIDQGHKFTSALNATLAVNAGAIAARWHSNWRQGGYDYRDAHKHRDGKVYAVRGSWALDKGLMKAVDGYTDDLTQPAEEPYCRCTYRYLYNLRDLPSEMLTAKGRDELERVKVS